MSMAKIAAIVLLAAAAAGAVTADAARAGLPSQTVSTKIQDRIAPSVGFAARAVSPADMRPVGARDRLDRAPASPLSTVR